MPSSAPSSESPYNPWGNADTNGGRVGPRYGSPTDTCDTCDMTDPSIFCQDGDPCDPEGAGGGNWCVFDPCDYTDPDSSCAQISSPPASSGPPEEENPAAQNNATGVPWTPGGTQPFGDLRDQAPNRPAQVTNMNSIGGETALVRDGIGQIYMIERDLTRNSSVSSPAGDSAGYDPGQLFPWGQTRSYANIEGSDTGQINGNRWLNKELGYLDFQGAAAGVNDPDRIIRRGLANQSWFFEKNQSTGDYAPLTAFYGQLEHVSDTFVITLESGEQWIYYDNSVSHPADLRGKLKGLTSSYGSTINLQYDVNDELERVNFQWWDSLNGENQNDLFIYEYYDTLDHLGMLKSVTYKHNGVNFRKVEYTYYTDEDGKGSDNDLKSARVWGWLDFNENTDLSQASQAAGGEWAFAHENFYRYYTEESSTGFAHGLKYALRGQACSTIRKAGIDPETASDTVLAQYADYYFEYSDVADGAKTRRVTLQKFRGGTETIQYSYTDNPDNPTTGDNNDWAVQTTTTNPDGSERRVYTNPSGGVLVSIYEDPQGNKTYDAMEFNDYGWNSQHAYPTAVNSVTEPSGGSTTLTVNYNTDAGLIYTFDYYDTDNPTTGAVAGRPAGWSAQEGSGGTPDLLDQVTWNTETVNGASIFPLWQRIRYPEAGMSSPPTLETEYTYYQDADGNDTLQVYQIVQKMPVVPTSQNGDGLEHEITSIMDVNGNLIWKKDARGYITNWQYRPDGVLMQRIDDVDTTKVENVPDGWTTPAGGGQNLVTDIVSDAVGKPLIQYGPWHQAVLHEEDTEAVNVRTVKLTLYRPDLDEVWTATGYATGNAPAYGYETVGEVTITRYDKNGKVTEKIRANRECTCGTLRATEKFPQKTWESWTQNVYDDWGRLLVKRVYHNIPLFGEGEKGEHYGETKYEYNEMGRIVRMVSPVGTITRTVYDTRGLAIERWVGTDDIDATNAEPDGGTSGQAAGNNMRMTLLMDYDNGDFNGNGLLTSETRPVDDTSANDQITEYAYDYRTLLVQTTRKDAVSTAQDLITAYTYNNFGYITQTDFYHTSVAAGNLRGRTKDYWDNLGRIYKSERYGVASNGTVGNAIRSESWRDVNGNVIKQLNQGSEAFSKTVYDGMNRPIENYLCCNAGTSTDDNDPSGDVVVEQWEKSYNPLGWLELETRYQRFHDATGNGALNGPNGSQPKARRYYTANWFDGVSRQVASANYGTNGGADLTRPAAVPDRSDTVLVTSYRYVTEYEADASIDPMGIETRWTKDALGRRIVLIENYDPSKPSSDYGANRTMAYRYTLDDQLQTLTLVNEVTGDQVTRWIYGTTLDDSKVARNDLLRAKIYPESDDDYDPLGDGADDLYERIEYSYNRQSATTAMTDPNGTVHEYDYDKFGRQTQDRVTTLASGIDNAVLRITTEYDDRGQKSKITSYDNATVGSGTVVNEVAYEYDDFGQLAADKQSHSGAVSGSTPEVSYAYENGSSGNTIRRTSMTYPDGRVVDYGYGSTSSADNLMSRVATIKINGESDNAAEYDYLGTGTVVKVTSPEPGVALSYIKTASAAAGDAGDQYNGYDRFGRVVDMRWATTSGGAVRDRFQYGYDRSSMRTWRSNLAASPGDGQDSAYRYDGLYQVTQATRGDLNINRTAVGGVPGSEETFSYDPTGNWLRYTEAEDGTVTLDQTRVNNMDNQITQFDGSSEDVEYDLNGNATEMPPDAEGDWTAGNYKQLKWDAWNRITEIQIWEGDQVTLVGPIDYDGQYRRLSVETLPTQVRHYYYNDQWKAVEERLDTETDAERQYVWGADNRNNLVLRDRDTTGNGTLDERLYATRDAMSSGAAVLDTSGAVQERYGYSAFGKRTVMAADFSDRSGTNYDWTYAFHGEFLDLETMLVNYGFRYYESEIGRWLGRDPIEENGGLNLLMYCGNNPCSNRDLFGWYLDWIPILGAVEDAIQTALRDFPGMKVEHYKSGKHEEYDICLYNMRRMKINFTIDMIAPNVIRYAVDIGLAIVGFIPTTPTKIAGLVGAVGAIADAVVTLWATQVISDTAAEATRKYCDDEYACNRRGGGGGAA